LPTLRILHLADIHLGMENYGRVDPVTGLSSRLGDFLRTLNIAIDWALENDVHLALIAGDVFKNRDPTPTVQREFARCVRRFSAAGMPLFLLVGNHDVPNALQRANTVDIYATLEVPLVTVAKKPGVHRVETRAGEVQIVAVPWISRSYLLTQTEHRNLDPDRLNLATVELIESFIDKSAADADPGIPTVLTAHASVAGAVLSSERNITLGHEVVIPKSVLANPRFDYVAMGHIHKYQVLSGGSPPIIYPGSLERIDFGEEHDPKGFVVVEIDEPGESGKREVRHEFHPVPARRFLTITVNAALADPTDEVLRRIDERADVIEDAVVRLVIETTPEYVRDLRQDEIRAALHAKKPSFMSVVTNSARPHRLRLGDQVIEQMTPRQALELYLQDKQATPDRIGTLLKGYDKIAAASGEGTHG
jgi:DNA repair protein SbcD/Mre11